MKKTISFVVICIVAYVGWRGFFALVNHKSPPAQPIAQAAQPVAQDANPFDGKLDEPQRKSDWVEIAPGYLTGNSYRQYDQDDKVMYLMGAVDGMLLAPTFDAPKDKMAWLERCILGMQSGQLLAIVEKWMAENPVRWKESMHGLLFSSFRASCPH